MGYDLHISRRKHWAEAEPEHDISLSEWLNYIDKDQDLIISHDLKINDEPVAGFCYWTAHSTKAEQWFAFDNGEINTKYPDDETIVKMVQVASVMNGNVQGDDGEHYELDGNNKIFVIKDRDEEISNSKSNNKWWKFW